MCRIVLSNNISSASFRIVIYLYKMNPLKWMIITVSVGRETIKNQIGSDSKVLINKNMNKYQLFMLNYNIVLRADIF